MRITLRLLILGVVLPLFAADARAEDWRALNQVHLPSRVRVIQFTNPIDATNCALWGAWNVCFGAKPPVATYVQNPVDCPILNIKIEGLRCSNKVSGQKDCTLNMFRVPSSCGSPNDVERCSIFSQGSGAVSFDVGCPAAIHLQ
jgi:hypothetical protein